MRVFLYSGYDFYKKQKRSRHERYRHLRRPRGQFEKYLSADTTGEACGTHGRVRFRKIHTFKGNQWYHEAV